MNIGILLKYYRKLNNLSQFALAEEADINEKYYGRIERGESSPTIQILERLCKGLNVSLERLAFAKQWEHEYNSLILEDTKQYVVARFLREKPPRFLAEVDMCGKIIEVYVGNSAKVTKFIALNDKQVVLEPIENTDARCSYSLFAKDNGDIWLMLNLNKINDIFEEAYLAGGLRGYNIYGYGATEVQVEKYKADYYIESERMIIENKTIISNDDITCYPMEGTERSIIQLDNLYELLLKGYQVRYNFFILTPWTKQIIWNEEYKKTLQRNIDRGMRIQIYYLYYENFVLKTRAAKITNVEGESGLLSFI